MKILAHTVAFDPASSNGCQQMARMLAASAVRTYLNGDFVLIHNSEEPLFQIQRHGLQEISVKTPALENQELADLGNRWKFQSRTVLDPNGYGAILFIDADCLILRNLDHLFHRDDWDILYQPERGRSIRSPVFNGYLTDEEMNFLSCDGANAGTWAVRGHIYRDVMQTWEEIMATNPVREQRWRDQTAWNRLLLDAPRYGWRAKQFEAHEIQFPLHLDKDWRVYRNAAIIHCVGGNYLEKIQFLFGMYMQTFFHDRQGTIPFIIDM